MADALPDDWENSVIQYRAELREAVATPIRDRAQIDDAINRDQEELETLHRKQVNHGGFLSEDDAHRIRFLEEQLYDPEISLYDTRNAIDRDLQEKVQSLTDRFREAPFRLPNGLLEKAFKRVFDATSYPADERNHLFVTVFPGTLSGSPLQPSPSPTPNGNPPVPVPLPTETPGTHGDILDRYGRETVLADAGDASDFSWGRPGDLATNASRGSAPPSSLLSHLGELADATLCSVASGAFSALEGAMERAIETGSFAADQFEHAMKDVSTDTLKSLGEQAMGRGIMEVGGGLADLGRGRHASAGKHFAAAGEYFVVAGLSGAAAGATSLGSGRGATKSGSSSIPSGAVPGSSTSHSRSVVQDITVIGIPSDEQLRSLRST